MNELRKIEKCKACEAPIMWAQTSAGKNMPVDAEPVGNGNVVLFPTAAKKLLAIVMSKTEADAWPGRERYVSHFATCAAAASFRKGPRKVQP